MSGRYRKEKDCLNCGNQVEDHFCSHCGQENIIVKEDALHMVIHAVADYFHFESKFFGTMKPLLLKPGFLTQKYVDGKRVSFIHPIRLYIFISIVFFVVILGGSHKEKKHVKETESSQHTEKRPDTLSKQEAADLRRGLSLVPIPLINKDTLIKNVTANRNNTKNKNRNSFWSLSGKGINSADSTVAAYENRQKALPSAQRDNFFTHYINKRNIELQDYPDVGAKVKEDFIHNLPKMMFVLLPLFALILKLVYISKKKYYYEHLIYSFHLHSALFLSVLVATLLSWSVGFFANISSWTGALCFFYIVWYIYRSLRTFYNSSRWVTVLKIFFLLFCYTILVSVTALLAILFTTVML